LDFQPGTGRLLETEHGPLGGDEINWILPGHNYGWPEIDHRRTHEGMEAPFLEFSPSIAPGSASFYRGQAFPELHGNFLVGCLRGEGMLRVELDGSHVRKMSWLFHHTFGRIREITESAEGYLYISTSQQDPAEGIPRPGDDDDLLLRIVPASLRAPQAIRRTLPRSQHLRHNGLLTPDLLPVAWSASSHSTAPPATARD
jgi:glucose/arabinose dehydrogenase